MLKRKGELKVDILENFVGGKGTVVNTHFLDREDACGAGRLFAKGLLSPGSSVGYHQHNGDFEVYYILSGKALVVQDGIEYNLNPGDSILARNGQSHSIENIGDVDLEYIAIILFDKES